MSANPPGPPSSEETPAKPLLTRGLAGLLLGGGLCLAVLAVAGAPPFDRVFAQTTAPKAASTITGAGGTYWLPVNAAEHGGEVDFLFNLITVVVGVTFIAVEALLVIFAIRYRHRPGRKAAHVHGNHKIEIAWTLIPALILVVLVFLSGSTWGRIRYGDPPDPATATNLEVAGQQFAWNFKLLGTGEKLGRESDLAFQGYVHVPVNRPVSVQLRSKDVLHSFFLPNMRVKLDAVPGMTGRLWFTPNRVGSYEVVCAELCGAEHWRMKAIFHVDTPEDYEQWLQAAAR